MELVRILLRTLIKVGSSVVEGLDLERIILRSITADV